MKCGDMQVIWSLAKLLPCEIGIESLGDMVGTTEMKIKQINLNNKPDMAWN